MPIYTPSSRDGYEDRDMSGLELADPAWTISLHKRPLLKAHKPLPKRRDYMETLAYVTALPIAPTANLTKENSLPPAFDEAASTSPPPPPPPLMPSPSLPLTPPTGTGDAAQCEVQPEFDRPSIMPPAHRNGATTPKGQIQPPTPDITPPRVGAVVKNRPFLETQPSISSRAESFRTACEELSSDDESINDWSTPQISLPWTSQYFSTTSFDRRTTPDNNNTPKQSRLRHELSEEPIGLVDTRPVERGSSAENGIELPSAGSSTIGDQVDESLSPEILPESPPPSPPVSVTSQTVPSTLTKTRPVSGSPNGPREMPARTVSSPLAKTRPQAGSPRGPREMPVKTEFKSAQAEAFAKAVDDVPADNFVATTNRVDSWRHSGISTSSTVEAVVVDLHVPKQQKLRHSRKNASLRSASSPIPRSTRSSWPSPGAREPSRLVRKPATLTNEKRSSMDFDTSRTVSKTSSLPPTAIQKIESIKVVVIPQRTSSLHGSADSSRRQSWSVSQGSRPSRRSEDSGNASRSTSNSVRKRANSDGSVERFTRNNRGRDRHYPPTVPARTSSLSAPTSRNNSRTSSMTSETLRMRRVAAEEDVRRTLARMESERSTSSGGVQEMSRDIQSPTVNIPTVDTEHVTNSLTKESTRPSTHRTISHGSGPLTPPNEQTLDWGHLRPPSAPYTPFSQHSALTSSSQGAIEIYEATAVTFYPHNNTSLQMIDRNVPETTATRQGGPETDIFVPSSEMRPPRLSVPDIVMDSPLKNPRKPPVPPAFKIIPPTPAGVTPSEEYDRQLGGSSAIRMNTLSRRLGSVKRALIVRHNSDSIRPSFIRSLSTTRARNRKQEQDLDHKLHPFWRPRSFWDEYSDSDSDSEAAEEDIVVNNSLGMPQSRIIFDGPLSLVRRISDRPGSRDRRVVGKASLNSLHQVGGFGNTNLAHLMTDLSVRMQWLRLQGMQDRISRARARRDERKREKRRVELRKRIGPHVLPKGDSRYPVMPSGPRQGVRQSSGPYTNLQYHD